MIKQDYRWHALGVYQIGSLPARMYWLDVEWRLLSTNLEGADIMYCAKLPDAQVEAFAVNAAT